MRSPLPFTGGDLRDIADGLDEFERSDAAASRVIRRVEVKLPDADETVGHFVRFDESDPEMGWGFVEDPDRE